MSAAGHRNPGIISQREVPVSSGRRLYRDGRPHQFIVEELSIEKVENFVKVATHSIVRCKLFHGDNSFQILMLGWVYIKRTALDEESKAALEVEYKVSKKEVPFTFSVFGHAYSGQDHFIVGTEKFKIYFLKIVINYFFV